MLQDRSGSLTWIPSSTFPFSVFVHYPLLDCHNAGISITFTLEKAIFKALATAISITKQCVIVLITLKQLGWVFVWYAIFRCFSWPSNDSIAKVAKPKGMNGVDVITDINTKARIELSTVFTAAVTWCRPPLTFGKPFATHSTVLDYLLVVKFHLYWIMFLVKIFFFVLRGLMICTVYAKKVPQSDYICMLLLPFLDLLTNVSVIWRASLSCLINFRESSWHKATIWSSCRHSIFMSSGAFLAHIWNHILYKQP